MLERPGGCMASLSADYYKRKSRADGTYDHARWLWLDGGHERCPRQGVVWKGSEGGVYLLCRVHAARTQVYPYLQPGPSCRQPCCAGERNTWTVSTWRPSKRLSRQQDRRDPGDESGTPRRPGDEHLRELYRRAANTSLLVTDPDDEVR